MQEIFFFHFALSPTPFLSQVNLRYGNSYSKDKTTCTACAGTMLLEFAALSRLTGDPQFEVKAHHAMEVSRVH